MAFGGKHAQYRPFSDRQKAVLFYLVPHRAPYTFLLNKENDTSFLSLDVAFKDKKCRAEAKTLVKTSNPCNNARFRASEAARKFWDGELELGA